MLLHTMNSLHRLQAPSDIIACPQVTTVISQPGRPRGRGKQRVPQPSPVEATAAAAGIESILCPASAKDVCARSCNPVCMCSQQRTEAM